MLGLCTAADVISTEVLKGEKDTNNNHPSLINNQKSVQASREIAQKMPMLTVYSDR